MRGHERGGAGEPAGVSRAAARDDRGTDLVGTRVRNAVDGKGAVTFLVRVKEALEDPRRLLMDL